jgi:hypothetical protein
MNETFQTGLHPDADQLAAFAEQALPLHEREQTLAHLAVCGDCRQIVFLAQAAAPEEMPQIAPEPVRRPWFSGWNLLWPAVAALAGIVGFSVYLGRVRSQDRAAQVNTAVVSSPQPPPAAQPPQPVAKAEALPEAKTKVRGGIETNAAPPPKQPASLPAVVAASPGPPRDRAAQRLSGMEDLPIEGRNTNSLGGVVAPRSAAGTGQATVAHGTAQPPAPQQFQRFAEAAKPAAASPSSQAAAAPAAPPPPSPAPPLVPQLAQNQATTQGYQQSQASPVTQANQASQTVNVEAANGAALALDSATLASTLAPIVPALPSHLETISSTSNGSELVAVDSGGSVFLSRDDGKHWKSVSEAWAGRPVKVELADPARPAISGLAKAAAPARTNANAAT